MATAAVETTAGTAVETNGAEATPSTPSTTNDWTTDKSIVRAWWKWTTKKVRNKKTGQVTEKQVVKYIAKVASEGQENWKRVEEEKDREGNPVWNFFSENSFNRHTVRTMEAFNALIAEEEQRAYIANSGVNYVQNSKMNSLAVEPKKGTGINGIPPEPAHSQEDIDLQSYINEKPGRTVKTIEEKISEMLQKSGMDAGMVAAFLAQMQAKAAAAAASGTALPTSEEGEEEEDEEEGEEGEEVPA